MPPVTWTAGSWTQQEPLASGPSSRSSLKLLAKRTAVMQAASSKQLHAASEAFLARLSKQDQPELSPAQLSRGPQAAACGLGDRWP